MRNSRSIWAQIGWGMDERRIASSLSMGHATD